MNPETENWIENSGELKRFAKEGKLKMKTLKAEGFRMPAEWHEHEATWLSWPKDPDTFPPNIIDNVENIYCQMIAALQEGEKVKILVDDEKWENKVRKKFESKGMNDENAPMIRRIPNTPKINLNNPIFSFLRYFYLNFVLIWLSGLYVFIKHQNKSC